MTQGVYRCGACGEKFEDNTAYHAHREQWSYDLWKVGKDIIRTAPGVLPPAAEFASRMSTNNMGWRCLNPREVGMARLGGVWIDGLTEHQKAMAHALYLARHLPAGEADDDSGTSVQPPEPTQSEG